MTSCTYYLMFSREPACAELIKYSEVCSCSSFGTKGVSNAPLFKNTAYTKVDVVPSGEEMKQLVRENFTAY